MIKYFFKVVAVTGVAGLITIGAMAQQDNEKARTSENDEIVIIKKGSKDAKLTVEIKDGEVKVNGQPLSEFKDDDVMISKRKRNATALFRSPFRGGATNFEDENSGTMRLNGLFSNGNKALLGVVTEKTDNGTKVNSVTKGSAAEKAGLKENDIITKVDETIVNSPEDLTKAIGKFKPEDKAVITYRRDKKEQKATVSLGKRDDATSLYGNQNEILRNFNFDFDSHGPEGFGIARSGSPRLGIKAQDTEEGKGVKVLNVDDESTAEKAGIQEGDIITEFDGKAVNSAMELADAARAAKDKNSMQVKLNRDGKSQEIQIKIPKKLKTSNL